MKSNEMLLHNLQPPVQHVVQINFLLEKKSTAGKGINACLGHKLDSSMRIKTQINTVQAVHIETSLHDVSPHASFLLDLNF